MKRKITILLAALLLNCGLMWAQQISWTAAEQGYENAEVIDSITFDSHVSAHFYAGTNSNAPKYYNTGSAIRCYGGNYFTVTSDYLLTEIILGFGSGDGTNAISTDCGTYADGTWTGSANSVTFSIGGTSGHRRIATFTITYTESGTPAPTITIENNNEIAYNATAGSFNFTVNNPVSGGNMTVATEEDWINNPSVSGTTVNFTTTVNQVGTPREGVITLTYTYGDQHINKPVTVTQAGNPNATMTIAEVRAQGTGAVATLGTVTSITGSSTKTAYIQDATAAIVVYGNFTADVGDEIRVSGTLSDYNGLLEIANPVVTVVSSGNTINPELMTIAEINASSNQGWYIRVENATVTAKSGQNTTIAQGNNTIVVRGISGVEYDVNDVLSLNGNIGYYNGNQIANPQNVEVQQNTEPTITITDATVNVQADASQGTIEVTYQNITEIVANVYFCDANGEAATYDWIYAEIDDDNNIYYNVDANDGAARTAYLKVNNGDVYSNLVTINQEAYVAPALDYAVLPFFFNGGRDDIEGTDGLSHDGLGSDYNVSANPTTILKFDGTGDWLLLHFLEAPGTLSFDIKGNGFSGGTFKVQTSVDGETYDDIATYTELGNTETKTFSELDENIRYIKWVYVEKSNGNVGLGDIKLYEFGGGPVAESYDLTIEPFENLEIFTFVDDELTEPFEGAGTIQVTEGVNVMLSVSAETGYVMQSLMVDGVEHVNDIDEGMTYTFVMPNHNVTVSATAVAFEPATYTKVTSTDQIVSGKTYIIVGFHEDEAFAMGEQRSNNRKGVAISVDGNTATVETAEVHEFVITALEASGFYSIYDDGYLYAASSSGNQLKTKAELDVNGQWEISVDTTAHIVASNSENRNVMQFNYNGGNTLFSCYSSASQSPVYLYVKEEATTTVTQTIALEAGASWVSFNVETTLNDLKAALLEATEGVQAITIQEQNNNVVYNPSNHRWNGRLNALDMAKMYKISVEAACEITVEGMPVDPTAHPISIENGSNWIAYPLSESMSLANAFAGFAVNGDKVQEQINNASYSNGRWSGQLRNLVPGAGYIYQSDVEESRTLVFPSVSGK